MGNQPLRLNKFLAERIGVSRREADDLIATGQVLVDGSPAVLGTRIDKSSKVCYNNSTIPFETDFLYLAMNKPVGYVCSRRAQGQAPTIYELLPDKYRHLKTVGRLDKDSSGLILLTNDGDFAFQMTHPKFKKTKVYAVTLDRPLAPLHQQMISDYGVMLDDGPSKFTVIASAGPDERMTALNVPSTGDDCGGGPPPSLRGGGGEQSAGPVERLSGLNVPSTGDGFQGDPHGACRRGGKEPAGPVERTTGPVERTHFTVVLSEGRNRQIRRTFAALGYQVVALHRTHFGKYELSGLGPGKYVIIKP